MFNSQGHIAMVSLRVKEPTYIYVSFLSQVNQSLLSLATSIRRLILLFGRGVMSTNNSGRLLADKNRKVGVFICLFVYIIGPQW